MTQTVFYLFLISSVVLFPEAGVMGTEGAARGVWIVGRKQEEAGLLCKFSPLVHSREGSVDMISDPRSPFSLFPFGCFDFQEWIPEPLAN